MYFVASMVIIFVGAALLLYTKLLYINYLPQIKGPNLTKSPPQLGCTLEAKICPDGTTVGRTGPNCEFALCPEYDPSQTISNYRECAIAPDSSVIESFPPQCLTATGEVFSAVDYCAGLTEDQCLADSECQPKYTRRGNAQGQLIQAFIACEFGYSESETEPSAANNATL
jgi:hypothetical protein